MWLVNGIGHQTFKVLIMPVQTKTKHAFINEMVMRVAWKKWNMTHTSYLELIRNAWKRMLTGCLVTSLKSLTNFLETSWNVTFFLFVLSYSFIDSWQCRTKNNFFLPEKLMMVKILLAIRKIQKNRNFTPNEDIIFHVQLCV